MMLDLSGLVSALADTSLSITREVTAWTSAGRTSSTSTGFTARGLVVPARAGSRPELQGDVATGSVEVYCATRLQPGDTFSYGGEAYVVDTVAGYDAVGNYCVAVARRAP